MVGDAEPSNKKDEGASDSTLTLYIHASECIKSMHSNDTLTDINYAYWSQEIMNFVFAKTR